MDIQAEKIELVKQLLNTNNIEIIKSIKKLFAKEENDFWNELSASQQKEINEAIQQVSEGKSTEYKTFILKHK